MGLTWRDLVSSAALVAMILAYWALRYGLSPALVSSAWATSAVELVLGSICAVTAASLHAELGQIVAGLRPGRESDTETILFWHRGLSLSDIALGHALLTKAAALGAGQRLRYA